MNVRRFLVVFWLFGALVAGVFSIYFPAYRFLLGTVAVLLAIGGLYQLKGND